MKAFLITICILQAIGAVYAKDVITRILAGAIGVWSFYPLLGIVNYS